MTYQILFIISLVYQDYIRYISVSFTLLDKLVETKTIQLNPAILKMFFCSIVMVKYLIHTLETAKERFAWIAVWHCL